MDKLKYYEKIREAFSSVLPIAGLVLLLSFTIAAMPSGTMLAFIFGVLFLIAGMILFTLGAELAMGPMGKSWEAE